MEDLEWNHDAALVFVSRDLSQQQRSEELFQRTFQMSPLPMAITRLRDGVVLECNQVFMQTMELPRERILGRNTVELGLVSFEMRQWLRSKVDSSGRIAA